LARDRYALRGWYDRLFDPVRRTVPALAVVGAFMGLTLGRARVVAVVLLVFLVYYSATLLLILPETKHTPPLVLPASVFAPVAIWGLTRWREASTMAGRQIRSLDGPRAARLAALLAGGIVLVLTASSATAAISRSARGTYLSEIARMSSVDVDRSAISPSQKG